MTVSQYQRSNQPIRIIGASLVLSV